MKMQNLTPEQEYRFFRLFASWPRAKKYEYIKQLSAEKAWRLKYTWLAWARDKQLAPNGDWATWVIQAGRGFGKTLAGAQWVVEKAQAYPECHIALVGRTVADVRDVMIKGRSGILSVSPPWFKPTYYPSRRQLVWPNGSLATTYTADAPDQLRGPQHSFAWADERCFIAGTLIRTSKGLCPIEKIKPGDWVYTREGLKRVKRAGLTNPSTIVYDLTTSDGCVLTGTENHPIWVQDKGFKPLHSLSYGDILMTWDQMKLDIASSGAVVGGGSMGDITATVKESCCTEPSIHPFTGLFLKECTSTTETAIRQITIFPILKLLHLLNTSSAILQRDTLHGRNKSVRRLPGNSGINESLTWQPASIAKKSSQQLGQSQNFALRHVGQHIGVKILLKYHHRLASDAEHHSWPIERECSIALLSALMRIGRESKQSHALFAEKSLSRTIHELCAVRVPVELSTNSKIGGKSRRNGHASIVRKSSRLTSHLQKRYSAQSPVATYTDTTKNQNNIHVLHVKKRLKKMAVFNIEVEDCHEYFANDVLVHNCSWQYDDAWDQLSFGLRIEPAPGTHPQCLVTTTPRNTKSMKLLVSDPTTVVTHGSTYENRENLSSRFIREIDRRYSGSRLGLQEIEGQIVDDIDGALWKRKWIDDGRVVKYPSLKRIVVAVDPPASSPETSDSPAECGIVVCGLGVDDHGYVLADYSTVGTPDEWASEALAAYSKHKADLIVGEVNNGGDMVGHTIKTAAKLAGMGHIPYEAIRASRGKMIRAEPVSTIYKNQHAHHVGTHPDLEFQLCNWVPGEKSPDRLDAAVWGITKLMLPDGQGGGVLLAIEDEKQPVPAHSWEEMAGEIDYY